MTAFLSRYDISLLLSGCIGGWSGCVIKEDLVGLLLFLAWALCTLAMTRLKIEAISRGIRTEP